MGIFFFLLFIPLLLLFLVAGGIGIAYALMGINQIIIGHEEGNIAKKKTGSITLLISLVAITLLAWLFYWIVNQ